MTTTTETTVELDATAQQWLAAYRQAKKRLEDDQELLDRCRDQLEAVIGDAEVATIDGEPAVTFKWSKPTARIDVKALREKEPELAELFTVTGQPSRRFVVVES